eukprot:216744_1
MSQHSEEITNIITAIMEIATKEQDKGIKLMHKIFDKILLNPNEQRYQSINISKLSKKFSNTINIWILVLLTAGFYKDIKENKLIFDSTKMQKLKHIKNTLQTLLDTISDNDSKSQPQIKWTHKELLIHGYVRLNKHKTIPLEIIEICRSFYSISLKIFTFGSGFSMSSGVWNFFISHLNSKNGTTLINRKCKTLEKVTCKVQRPWCYIPNISTSINNINMCRNKCFDGIIGSYYTSQPHNIYPTLLLFEANKIKMQNDIVEYNAYNSSQTMPQVESFNPQGCMLYCGDKHGVIYQDECIMYQLKLNEIDLKLNNFKFIKMKQDNNTFFDARTESPGTGSLSLNYLQYHNKIFGINVFSSFFDSKPTTLKLSSFANCGIFDLDNCVWKQVKSYEYNTYSSAGIWGPIFMAGLSFNNLYDTNCCQYIVSNIGHTAKYDMNKNKWITIVEDLKMMFRHNTRPVVWFDDNPSILYCVAESNKKFRGFLDIRNNNPKWIESGEILCEYDYHLHLCTFF